MRRKFFLTRKDQSEQEVTKTEYVVAERTEGFSNKMGEISEPATNSFQGRHVSGRTEYFPE